MLFSQSFSDLNGTCQFNSTWTVDYENTLSKFNANSMKNSMPWIADFHQIRSNQTSRTKQWMKYVAINGNLIHNTACIYMQGLLDIHTKGSKTWMKYHDYFCKKTIFPLLCILTTWTFIIFTFPNERNEWREPLSCWSLNWK